jgi:putative adenylate-forming enzyme
MRPDRLAILAAWLDARGSAKRLRTRADLERRQARLWRRLQPALARTPALAALAGSPLQRFPTVTPQTMRAEFDARNSLGLSRREAETAALAAEAGGDGEVAPDVSAGFSTGTSGTRGLFLASRKERGRYIGHALARLLPPDALTRRRRIALCLRADNRLYRDAGGGPIEIRFFGLDGPSDARLNAIIEFAPDVLIAPSGVLADIARQVSAGARFPKLERLFYGAEPMGEAERAWIQGVLGARPDPIYQATEGFLGCACVLGTLHLNEEVLIVEREPVTGTDRFQPIVTDLRRVTQPMVRVLLDDLLEPLPEPCPCGSPRLAVRGVEGRVGDLWRWGDAVITPRAVDTLVSAAAGAQREWRAVAARDRVTLEIDGNGAAPAQQLEALLRLHDVRIPVEAAPLSPQDGPKRRRVSWTDG